MSLQVEKLEKNMAKLTIEVSAEELDKAIQAAYIKNRNRFSVPGFRKGKTPQVMIEKMYGPGVFYEDAANELMRKAYAEELEDIDLDIVSSPEIDVVQLEKGMPFIFTAQVAIKPEVILGTYKGLEIEKQEIVVTEEEITAEIDKALNQNARTLTIVDRPAGQDDTVVIDFEGFVDGVAFEGGKAEDYNLIIGSGTFIPGFEEQLAGMNLGEEKDVEVTFPEEYHAEELAGRQAVFKVALKEIRAKELPELDDEFAQDVSDFNTLEEYKASIQAMLADKKAAEAKDHTEDLLIEKLIEEASFEVPDAMLETQVRRQAEDFARRMEQQGISLEQYMSYTGASPDKIIDQIRPNALKRIQTRLVLEAVVKAENIEVTDEELNQEIETLSKRYQAEMPGNDMNDTFSKEEKETIKIDIAVRKALDFVVAEAKETA